MHAVRTPRPSNEREEEKVNGKESEETREESPKKSDDDEVVRPATNFRKRRIDVVEAPFLCSGHVAPYLLALRCEGLAGTLGFSCSCRARFLWP